jgi:hypothetical protein
LQDQGLSEALPLAYDPEAINGYVRFRVSLSVPVSVHQQRT